MHSLISRRCLYCTWAHKKKIASATSLSVFFEARYPLTTATEM